MFVSKAQGDLAAGNTSEAMKWLAAYYQDHPGSAVKTTGRHFRNITGWQTGDIPVAVRHPGAVGQRPGILRGTLSHLFHRLSGTRTKTMKITPLLLLASLVLVSGMIAAGCVQSGMTYRIQIYQEITAGKAR